MNRIWANRLMVGCGSGSGALLGNTLHIGHSYSVLLATLFAGLFPLLGDLILPRKQ